MKTMTFSLKKTLFGTALAVCTTLTMAATLPTKGLAQMSAEQEESITMVSKGSVENIAKSFERFMTSQSQGLRNKMNMGWEFARKQGRKDRHGIDLLWSINEQLFEPPFFADEFFKEWDEKLDQWISTEPSNPNAYFSRAFFGLTKFKHLARTTRDFTPQQQDKLRKQILNDLNILTGKLDENYWQAYALMVDGYVELGIPYDEVKQHFAKAHEISPYNYIAYRAMLLSMHPDKNGITPQIKEVVANEVKERYPDFNEDTSPADHEARRYILGRSQQLAYSKMLQFAKFFERKGDNQKHVLGALIPLAHKEISKGSGLGARYFKPDIWLEINDPFRRLKARHSQSGRWNVEFAELAFLAGKNRIFTNMINELPTIDPKYKPHLAAELECEFYYKTDFRAGGDLDIVFDACSSAANFDKVENLLIVSQKAAMVAKQMERYPEAIRYLGKALQVDPNNPFSLTQFCWNSYYINAHEQAEKACLAAISNMENNSDAYLALGKVYKAQGKHSEADKAQEQYRRLINQR